jgi:hypothetical protein
MLLLMLLLVLMLVLDSPILDAPPREAEPFTRITWRTSPSVQRALHPHPRGIEHVRVNHRRAYVLVP